MELHDDEPKSPENTRVHRRREGSRGNEARGKRTWTHRIHMGKLSDMATLAITRYTPAPEEIHQPEHWFGTHLAWSPRGHGDATAHKPPNHVEANHLNELS